MFDLDKLQEDFILANFHGINVFCDTEGPLFKSFLLRFGIDRLMSVDDTYRFFLRPKDRIELVRAREHPNGFFFSIHS